MRYLSISRFAVFSFISQKLWLFCEISTEIVLMCTQYPYLKQLPIFFHLIDKLILLTDACRRRTWAKHKNRLSIHPNIRWKDIVEQHSWNSTTRNKWFFANLFNVKVSVKIFLSTIKEFTPGTLIASSNSSSYVQFS